MADVPHLDEFTDAEVLASHASQVCAVCGRLKRASVAFCATDMSALPWQARQAVSDPAQPGFCASFRGWLRHLQLHPVRRRLLPSRPGDLPYRSLSEFEAAGYKFSRRAQCGSVRCLQPIVWLLTPSRRYLALDEGTWQPHEQVCRDPGWWQRRREQRQLKTSARRRRKAS